MKNNCKEDLSQGENGIMVKSISKIKEIVEAKGSTISILIKDQFNSFYNSIKTTHKGDSNRKIFNKTYFKIYMYLYKFSLIILKCQHLKISFKHSMCHYLSTTN